MPPVAIPPLDIGGNVKRRKLRVDIDHGPKALQLEYLTSANSARTCNHIISLPRLSQGLGRGLAIDES